MADLEELMTDEPVDVRPNPAWATGRNALRAELRPGYRALTESRDRAETTLEMVKVLADGYGWLSEGRGMYAYDDGRYDDDVRAFTGQLLELLPSGNWLGMREWEAKFRALRESHDALVRLVKSTGWSVPSAGDEWHHQDCGIRGGCTAECKQARAALAKAEALHG